MRSFYLRIRIYAIEKCGPKFVLCDLLFFLPRIYAILMKNSDFLMKKSDFKFKKSAFIEKKYEL